MLRRKPTRISVSQIDIHELDAAEERRAAAKHNKSKKKSGSKSFQFQQRMQTLPKQQRIGFIAPNQT